ncbi:MAG: insulinase family protein [Anaerolineae bacterium]|nr:insulinase family protein [Anaerolineae bacterium]
MRLASLGILLLAVTALPAGAQTLADFEENVTEHTLGNGMKFIIVERHEVPVVSFFLRADVGAVDEKTGHSGLAHLFEHMAFKGTSKIGTKEFEKEKQALANVDSAYAAWAAERRKGDHADPNKLQELETAFRAAQKEAAQYVKSNEFSQVIEKNGGVSLNAGTGSDQTVYFFSLPSNKLELWFSLESSRFLDPVLREFYKERQVVMEERRLRIESQPIGKLVEEFLAVAYKAHPYGRSGIGWRSDLEHLTREHAREFFQTYYTPRNLTAVLVGDVEPQEAIRLAELYFGRIPAGPEPDVVWTEEPEQEGERRTALYAQSQPILVIGYHKPSIRHSDDAVFDAVQDILAAGRTSRLYRSLVQEKKLAVAAGGFPGFPGEKYPNLFVFYSVAAANKTNEENEQAMLEELEHLRTELVTEEELARVKQRARAQLVQQLSSNLGLAGQLASYEVLTGDWRDLFRRLEAIDKVTREDIQRVAKEYFTERNRTVGYLVPEEPAASGKEERN